MVETVSFRIRSSVHALATLSLFDSNVVFFFAGTVIIRTNCTLHLAHNIFWKTDWLLHLQSQEGCHQLFAELPGELEIGQILLVHFDIKGSGFGSHCIKEDEVSIKCPSLRFSPFLSTNWHKIHHINASLHVIIVDQALRFHIKHCCQSQHNFRSSLCLICIGKQDLFAIVAPFR